MRRLILVLSLLLACGSYRNVLAYSDAGYPYTVTSGCMKTCQKDDNPALGFCKNNCTSYVAYILNKQYGVPFKNGYGGTRWGNGGNWDNAASKVFGDNVVDKNPIPGDVAYWDNINNILCDKVFCGHVAFVEKVYYDNTGDVTGIDVTEYNYTNSCKFDERAGNDRLNVEDVDYPDGFIHILAYNEGVTSLHYLDCYEMYSLCDFQTKQEWEWILSRVAGYRCKNCIGQYMATADDFYDAFAMGGGNTGNGGGADSPNLQVRKFEIRDSFGNLLSEQNSFMQIGQTYEINVWPVSKKSDCKNGIKKGKDTVETDVFYKIALDDSDGDWKFLGRTYTRAITLVKDKSHKETLHFAIPEEAAGYRIYFKAKVDSTGEVKETDEGDNWSDNEWYPVQSSCDLVISSAGLTKGRTSLNESEYYGFEMYVRNEGTTPCPIGFRSAYYHKKPGATSWDKVADDGSDAKELMPDHDQYEVTLKEPFIADTPGTHEGMVCADYLDTNPETDKNNNCTSFAFEVKFARPDFIVSSLGFKEGTVIKKGSRVHPYCVIKNIGNATPTKGIRSAYYIDGDKRADDGTDANQLAPGQEQREEVIKNNIKLGDKGDRTLTCCADFEKSVVELNENNNCSSISFTVAK